LVDREAVFAQKGFPEGVKRAGADIAEDNADRTNGERRLGTGMGAAGRRARSGRGRAFVAPPVAGPAPGVAAPSMAPGSPGRSEIVAELSLLTVSLMTESNFRSRPQAGFSGLARLQRWRA